MEQDPSGSNDADRPGRVDAALPATELHNERRPFVIRWSVKAAVLLANGYVRFFFSERVFWFFLRALWPARGRAMREEQRCNTQPEAVK